MKAGRVTVLKTIKEFDVAASFHPRRTFDHLAALEWIRAPELLRIGPAGQEIAPSLVAFGVAAVQPDPGSATSPPPTSPDPLPGLADNSVGRVIEETCYRDEPGHIDGSASRQLDDTGAQLLLRFVRRAYAAPRPQDRLPARPLDRWAGSCPSTPPPLTCGPAPAWYRDRGHRRSSLPDAPGPDQEQEDASPRTENHQGDGLPPGRSGDTHLAVDRSPKSSISTIEL